MSTPLPSASAALDAVAWRPVFIATWREFIDDDCLDVAAQLSYYVFLSLFPACIVLLALASFFPLQKAADDVTRVLAPILSAEVLAIVRDQMHRLAQRESSGALTLGVLGALWSSSSALVSIVKSMNVAYDLEESRPWWNVRLVAIGLTIAIAVIFLIALSLIVIAPDMAARLGVVTGLGPLTVLAWDLLRWPAAFALIVLAFGTIYYLAPDAELDWVWVTPGALVGAALWILGSFGLKVYFERFTDYDTAYGAVGGVIVLMMWVYVSSLAILIGAELNSEIDHAQPYGKDGVRNERGRRVLGRRAARLYRERTTSPGVTR